MKRALISMLYLLTFLTTCFSQTATLSKKMATYRNFCLKVREGVELKNVQTLKECIAEWTGDINTIIYQNDTVRITDFDRFSVTDGSNEVGLNKHLLYRPEFIDSLIVYDIGFANNYIEKPLLLRASYDCKLVHRALAPHSKGTYSSKGSGKRELLVVAENGGIVNLYVNDEKNGIHVSDTSPQGKAAAWVCWEMDSFGIYTITVENTSDKEISFVITSN